MRNATEYERADRERDYRKHEPRPSDITVSQLFALTKLLGNCEGVVESGVLSDDGERFMRANIAEALAAFGMPSKSERADA